MDGDFAPMVELVKLRKKHGFLLAIDDVSLRLHWLFTPYFGYKTTIIKHEFPIFC